MKTYIIQQKNKVLLPLYFIFLLWIIQIINSLIFNQQLSVFGIYPRTESGLFGILFAPFLHLNYQHLIGNSFMFLLLSWVICFYDISTWIKTLIFGSIIGGFITWLIGSSGYHIGASILIFSLLGTILGIAIFHKNIFFIFASIILISLYGVSIFYGLIPQDGISFAGHLGGFISGLFCSKYLHSPKKIITTSITTTNP